MVVKHQYFLYSQPQNFCLTRSPPNKSMSCSQKQYQDVNETTREGEDDTRQEELVTNYRAKKSFQNLRFYSTSLFMQDVLWLRHLKRTAGNNHIPLRLCGLNLQVQILQTDYQFYASLFDIYTNAKDLIKTLITWHDLRGFSHLVDCD